MDTILQQIHSAGRLFIDFALPMLVQSSVVIVVLLGLDLVLRKRIRATFRYWIWMIVLVKFVLPTTLSSPTSPAYWFGDGLRGFVTGKLMTSEKADVVSPKISVSTEPSMLPESATAASSTKDAALSPIPAPSVETDTVAAPAVRASSITWQGFIFVGWLAAVVTMVVLLIQRTFFVRALIAQSQKPGDVTMDTLQRARELIGVRRKVSLGLSPATVAPSVCGLFHPTILIPKALAGKVNPNDLKSILLHELAHIKRGDLWVSLIQTIVQIIYIYHPLLWAANAVIRKVREQAADEMVLTALGEEGNAYPETLLNVSRLTFGSPALSLQLIGVGE